MTDPGYGSYLASAAEKERDRRSEGQQLLKKLDMQKYGIDTQASTSRYATDSAASTADKNREVRREELQSLNERSQRDFDEQVRQFGLQDERQQALFDIGMKEEEVKETIGGYITDASAKRSEETKKRDLLESNQLEADQYSGFLVSPSGDLFPNFKEWYRGLGGGDAYSSEYDLTIGGKAVTPQIDPLDLTTLRMTPENLQEYAPHIETADKLYGDQSTTELQNNVWNLWGLINR